MHKSGGAVLHTASLHPDTATMTSISGEHSACFHLLCELLAEKKETILYGLVSRWSDDIQFKTGGLWQLLNCNVSNLRYVFDHQVRKNDELRNAMHESVYHVESLLHRIDAGNWLDLWAKAVSDHLEIVTSAWMFQYFDRRVEGAEEEEDTDGAMDWPPAPLEDKIWCGSVADFSNLENAFDGLENIFLVQDLDEEDPHFQHFHYWNIERPLADLKSMREILLANRLPVGASGIAWCVFAEILLNSLLKMQSLLLCTKNC